MPTTKIYSQITYSGVKPEMRIKGGYKKFTVSFFDDGEPTNYIAGDWHFEIDGVDAFALLEQPQSTTDVAENQIKVKFIGDNDYIGKVMTVSFETVDGAIKSSIEIEIKGL